MPKYKILIDRISAEQLKQFNEIAQIDSRPYTAYRTDSANVFLEYDAIILNPVDPQRVDSIVRRRAAELSKFLNCKHRIFVYILNSYVKRDSQDNVFFLARILELPLPNTRNVPEKELGNLFVTAGKGEDYTLTSKGQNSPITEYLNLPCKQWQISLRKEKFGSIVPLAVNASGDIVAFTLSGLEDRAFFIPNLANFDKLIQTTIAALDRIQLKRETAPTFVNNYETPGTKRLKKAILSKEKKIEQLSKQKGQLAFQLDQLEEIRDVLLTGSGKVLQTTVIKVLNELGLNAREGEENREDVLFDHKGLYFVCEVKGKTKSAAEEDLAQLAKWKTNYRIKHKQTAKGLLIANPWRKIPVEERNTNDRPNFPDQMKQLCGIEEVCLLTTPQLFVAYGKFLRHQLKIDTFVNDLNKTVWIYKKHLNIESFLRKADETS